MATLKLNAESQHNLNNQLLPIMFLNCNNSNRLQVLANFLEAISINDLSSERGNTPVRFITISRFTPTQLTQTKN